MKDYLSPKQLAEELGVPLGTIYRWRSEHKGPPGFRVGRHVRYPRRNVDGWIQGAIEAERRSA